MLYACWAVAILCFALLHAVNLSADFPNHSPWIHDWAKYTDEGWYGNAAVRAHLFGNWYLAGDFNPAVALPVWPFLEWLLFFPTGVRIEAARGLAVACFFLTLALSYLLLRRGEPQKSELDRTGQRWVGLLALTLLVTSPFLYGFSRLAILEPLLTTLMLAALNLAVRLGRLRRQVLVSVLIGLLFTLMTLTKTTAVFLLPALGWAMLVALWGDWKRVARCVFAAGAASALTYGLWMALIIHAGLLPDYKYLFLINSYPKPSNHGWMWMSLWWSFHGGLWIDRILVPLAGLMFAGGVVGARSSFGRRLLADPAFGASVLAVAGCILFMTVQNHPQPRYFAVVAVFCFFIVAQGAGALLRETGWRRQIGWGAIAAAVVAIAIDATWTFSYATHPEFTFIEAAQALTRYIDQHPNGKRLLVSTSGDQLTLMAHAPSLCDDFGTIPLHDKIARYQPGWFASWNDLDPGALADLHTHFSLEQVATFDALDDPERQRLVLFKLHPLPQGRVRDQVDQNLQIELPGDRFDVPIE
jgi:hypothetical protein